MTRAAQAGDAAGGVATTGFRRSAPFQWAGGHYSGAVDQLNEWVPNIPGQRRWGLAVATVVDVGYGGFKVTQGAALVAGGTAADVTGIGAILGIPAQTYGTYQLATGGARVIRGVRAGWDFCTDPVPDGEEYGLGNAADDLVWHAVVPLPALWRPETHDWIDNLGSGL